MKKRGLALLLALLLFSALQTAALAQTLGGADAFMAALSGLSGDSWLGAHSLRLGEGAQIFVGERGGEAVCASVAMPYSEPSADAPLASAGAKLLAAAGARDPEALIADIAPDKPYEVSYAEQDGLRAGMIWGKNRATIFVYGADEGADLVFLPLLGGKKRHCDPACSGMDGPRLATVETAESLGFDRCKKCPWP